MQFILYFFEYFATGNSLMTKHEPQANTAQDDLAYVASALRRRDVQYGVPSIFFLWSALFLVGWSLPDFAPRFTAPYWLVAGVGGGLLSWWLGARHELKRGEVDIELGKRYGYHWLICGAAFFGVFLPFMLGGHELTAYAADLLGRQFLLVCALAYGLAALHLERGLALPAAIMGVGYLVLNIWSPTYLWTSMAVLISAALFVAGLQARR